MKRTCWLILLPVFALQACLKNNSNTIVTIFAGNGSMGMHDGRGDSASFANPMGITADRDGNLFVADSHNNLIRKINSEGDVSTFAGSGAPGSCDGQGAKASFFYPGALAADSNGNIYVADTHNNLIRKITPAGTVSTVAGRLTHETADLDSPDRFDNPSGIAVDKAGNIYVADWNNDEVRKITGQGTTTIIAGSRNPGASNGISKAATFYLPGGIAVDGKGNIFVADTYNNMIREIKPNGWVTTLAGQKKKGAQDGKGATAAFLHPQGIAIDGLGNIIVADMGNNTIRQVSTGGIVTTIAGNGSRGEENGPALQASFSRPYSVAVGPDGSIYVADFQNNLIRKIQF